MATEEEIAAARAAADEAQEAATKAAEEAAAKVREADALFAKIKAEAPAIADIAAAVAKTRDEVEAIRAEHVTRSQRESQASLLRHVRDVMQYTGTLDDEELIKVLPAVDPSTKDGAEKLERFREKHMREFRARTISPTQMVTDLRSTLAQNDKIKSSPFFSIEAGLKSLGRKS